MGEKNLTQAMQRNAEKIAEMEKRAGIRLHECYQCGKCSAGCPMAESMDLMPRQVIRCLQLGLLEDALSSKAPWICATCHTCSARCPHGVEISVIMETVRQEAANQGIKPVRTADLFTKDFMVPVSLFGRSHELTMTGLYNLTSGHIFQNFPYVPKMLTGGKIKIIPEMVKGSGEIRKIIDNCEQEAKQK